MTEVSGNGAKPASDPGNHGAFARWFNRRGWADLTIATPYVWLVIFFLVPFLIVVAMSVATRTPTSPPFSFGGVFHTRITITYIRIHCIGNW